MKKNNVLTTIGEMIVDSLGFLGNDNKIEVNVDEDSSDIYVYSNDNVYKMVIELNKKPKVNDVNEIEVRVHFNVALFELRGAITIMSVIDRAISFVKVIDEVVYAMRLNYEFFAIDNEDNVLTDSAFYHHMN